MQPKPLPLLFPRIPNQRWSCHSCGNCCRTLVVHLFDEDRRKIDEQDWGDSLSGKPYVRAANEWALNKRPDGSCVFLDDDNRCMIHAKYGEDAKPIACRMFPFSVREVPHKWQVSIRFDCPSVVKSNGDPLQPRQQALDRIVSSLDRRSTCTHGAKLVRGIEATQKEENWITDALVRWLTRSNLSHSRRLLGAARVTHTLQSSSFKKIRGTRLAELLDLLFDALPAECERTPLPPTDKQCGMLRQLAFAHAEHVSLAEIRANWFSKMRKRFSQLAMARRFLRGKGLVPSQPHETGETSFSDVERVTIKGDLIEFSEELLQRYLISRLKSDSVFGGGYYGWPVFKGLGALWLSVAVAGWVARHIASADKRNMVSKDDITTALGVVDRSATRAPALGAAAEQIRLTYLMNDDGIARLLFRYALFDERAGN